MRWVVHERDQLSGLGGCDEFRERSGDDDVGVEDDRDARRVLEGSVLVQVRGPRPLWCGHHRGVPRQPGPLLLGRKPGVDEEERFVMAQQPQRVEQGNSAGKYFVSATQ